MPTVTGTLTGGSDNPLLTTMRWWQPRRRTSAEGPPIGTAAVVLVTTSELGEFAAVVTGGTWVVTYPVGSQVARHDVVVPHAGGPYDWADLVAGMSSPPSGAVAPGRAVADFSALRLITALQHLGTVYVACRAVPYDGYGGKAVYDATDTTEDDNAFTIRPAHIAPEDPGRWKIGINPT